MRKSLGALTATVLAAAAVPAAAQSGEPTACSIIDRTELTRITGKKELAGFGPQAADPSEVPKGVSECEYLGLTFQLTSPLSAQSFASTRDAQVKGGTKIQPITGLGDDAYYWWDPKPGDNRQVGVAFRVGSRRLIVTDMTHADSIETVKPRLLTIAKAVSPKLR